MKKAELRKEFLQKREDADGLWLVEKNALITQNLEKYLLKNTFETLHTFLPQLNSREVHTFYIIELLRITFPEMRIVAPYIIPGTKEMKHFLLTPEGEFVVNRWQIPEPDPGTSESVLPKEIDIVLVPLLAFDRKGYRVGYGGGYYDRFLAQTRSDCVKIGLSMFDPIDQISDIDEFDIQLDLCITPDQIYEF
ncbi:5-formyltetrahydrofolate cyclo-ligase [Dyadobacter sp. CECT 9623]|uniref:5-formyltetrahydrofolate cyclo-ligase n=1 Tax=Dyadobacter linearis TaxID=2823330 RepID=A0ABM8UWU4_9BACT|nr:5-formyltetrahydrofolate cyclo-ligase [Dyadobacter sp. CECT 9623]CAG5073643.1 5-formyltetrahydrofolate cyclo-ligase [Dyadobacter sp. CECT 9623]